MFSAFADWARLWRAATALIAHDVILPAEYHTRLPWPATLAGRFLRLFKSPKSVRPGERLARALESLGPAYIKLGQFLATRPDVFGVEVSADLSRLKDSLAPFAMTEARRALRAEFGAQEADRLFGELSEPVAAASLAQVHRLKTEAGDKAVKILRPGVEAMIYKELRALRRAAATVERVSEDSRRMRPLAFIETVGASMIKELDLRIEAGGADEMRVLAEKGDYFKVPGSDWERTSARVLTTDWVDGTPLTAPDFSSLVDSDKAVLATKITRGFLDHAIGHGVFHADMHEGNMILGEGETLFLIDFGLIGRIGVPERRFLAEILSGFLRRDYVRIAEVHFEAGYVPSDKSVGDFAQALRSVGEPIHGKTAKDVSMGRLLLQLLDFTHTFGMQLRPELVLLQKTMVQVEGVARTLDPNHDIWTAAEPVVTDWVKANMGPAGAAKLVSGQMRDMTDRLKRLPEIMDKIEAVMDNNLHASTQRRATGTPQTLLWLLCGLGLGAGFVWLGSML